MVIIDIELTNTIMRIIEQSKLTKKDMSELLTKNMEQEIVRRSRADENIKLLKEALSDDMFLQRLATLNEIPTIEIVANCVKYSQPYKCYNGACKHKYVNLQNAINESVQGDTLWVHNDLGLYGLYKKDNIVPDNKDKMSPSLFKYIEGINHYLGYSEESHTNQHFYNIDEVIEHNKRCKIDNKDYMSVYKPYQILLSCHPTKLIFECWNDSRIIEYYIDHIKIHFKSRASHIELNEDSIQITVEDILYKSLQESMEAFVQFVKYINELDIRMPLPNQLKTTPCIFNNQEETYREIKLDVSELLKINDTNQAQFLSTVNVSDTKVVININIHNGNNVTNNYNTTNITNTTINNMTSRWLNNDKNRPLLLNQLADWIKINPPKGGEYNVSYHKRYTDFIGDKDKWIGITQFVMVVKSIGYKYVREGKNKQKRWLNSNNT
jgi:hypothetical protein